MVAVLQPQLALPDLSRCVMVKSCLFPRSGSSQLVCTGLGIYVSASCTAAARGTVKEYSELDRLCLCGLAESLFCVALAG